MSTIITNAFEPKQQLSSKEDMKNNTARLADLSLAIGLGQTLDNFSSFLSGF